MFIGFISFLISSSPFFIYFLISNNNFINKINYILLFLIINIFLMYIDKKMLSNKIFNNNNYINNINEKLNNNNDNFIVNETLINFLINKTTFTKGYNIKNKININHIISLFDINNNNNIFDDSKYMINELLNNLSKFINNDNEILKTQIENFQNLIIYIKKRQIQIKKLNTNEDNLDIKKTNNNLDFIKSLFSNDKDFEDFYKNFKTIILDESLDEKELNNFIVVYFYIFIYITKNYNYMINDKNNFSIQEIFFFKNPEYIFKILFNFNLLISFLENIENKLNNNNNIKNDKIKDDISEDSDLNYIKDDNLNIIQNYKNYFIYNYLNFLILFILIVSKNSFILFNLNNNHPNKILNNSIYFNFIYSNNDIKIEEDFLIDNFKRKLNDEKLNRIAKDIGVDIYYKKKMLLFDNKENNISLPFNKLIEIIKQENVNSDFIYKENKKNNIKIDEKIIFSLKYFFNLCNLKQKDSQIILRLNNFITKTNNNIYYYNFYYLSSVYKILNIYNIYNEINIQYEKQIKKYNILNNINKFINIILQDFEKTLSIRRSNFTFFLLSILILFFFKFIFHVYKINHINKINMIQKIYNIKMNNKIILWLLESINIIKIIINKIDSLFLIYILINLYIQFKNKQYYKIFIYKFLFNSDLNEYFFIRKTIFDNVK